MYEEEDGTLVLTDREQAAAFPYSTHATFDIHTGRLLSLRVPLDAQAEMFHAVSQVSEQEQEN